MSKIKRTLSRLALVGAVTAIALFTAAPKAQALDRCTIAYQQCIKTCGGAGNIFFFSCDPEVICDCF